MTTKAEMTILLQQEVKGLTSYLNSNDYSNACDDAERETGWSFPVSGDFKIYWQKQRAKRHLFFYLMTESAVKFKAKQFSLNQKFEHLKESIEFMDQEFMAIQEARPEEFGSVDPLFTFGTKIDAGFVYEPQTGRDVTYDEDQNVIFTPDENA